MTHEPGISLARAREFPVGGHAPGLANETAGTAVTLRMHSLFASPRPGLRVAALARVHPVLFMVMALSACDTSTLPEPDGKPDGWSEETHGPDAVPAYDEVFPLDRVHRLDIAIAPADWDAMFADMADMAGAFGADAGMGPGPGGPPPGDGDVIRVPPEAVAACAELAVDDPCSFALGGQVVEGQCIAAPDQSLACMPSGLPGGGPPVGGSAEIFPRTPLWVPSTVSYEGRVWEHVGVRFKGNSTLMSTWRRGIYKLPLRLRFDRFEDEYPEIGDQRFFGFQSLSLSNNVADASFLREKVIADLLREGGVPAARTTFVRVYVDVGEGPTYFGLYTLTEIPDQPMLDAQLGGGGGNLYEPQGDAARWTSFDPEDFEKETNEDEADWRDVERAIAALHADRTDAAAWRAGLEQRFDAHGFLRWLAANTILANWDAYGVLAHNYYLYGAPADGGRLHWIPWDHDLALGSMSRTSLLHTGIDETWPLIRFLLDDPEYRAHYLAEARAFLDQVFQVDRVEARLRAEHDRIAPYVVGPEGEQPGYGTLSSEEQFDAALSGPGGLIEIVTSRRDAVSAELAASAGSL